MKTTMYPEVISPSYGHKIRRGKGFSAEELKAIKISVNHARELGLPVDERRRTLHKENVDLLKRLLAKQIN
jgi:large subunit ribosomal protein L13e